MCSTVFKQSRPLRERTALFEREQKLPSCEVDKGTKVGEKQMFHGIGDAPFHVMWLEQEGNAKTC